MVFMHDHRMFTESHNVSLSSLLLQAREGVLTRFRPILNAAGLTEQQWRILRTLLIHGSLEPRIIGKICGLWGPSLTGILSRMDDMGLVRRERLERDQRRVMVSVTDKGQALVEELAPRIEATYSELEAHIGPDFAKELYQTLHKLNARLLQDPEPR
jgi:homoprotocatechuate degradation regulator HpaR